MTVVTSMRVEMSGARLTSGILLGQKEPENKEVTDKEQQRRNGNRQAAKKSAVGNQRGSMCRNFHCFTDELVLFNLRIIPNLSRRKFRKIPATGGEFISLTLRDNKSGQP